MSLHELPSLRESLIAQGLFAKKSFGQHFLLDLNLTRKIARLAGPLQGCVVIEVGAGPGGLTRALLETEAAHVIAIEKDRRFADLLQALRAASAGRLTIVEADALEVNERDLVTTHAPDQPARIVANLPYNVATPLLLKWLTGAFQPESMTLMFQKEVAQRIAATVGQDDFGRLSVLSQAIARASVVMTLPPQAFTPPPRVDSAVVRLDLRPDRPNPARRVRLEAVTRAAFGQRRKMLRSSLKPVGGEALCLRAGVDATARAEELGVEDFLRLSDALVG